MTGAEIIELVLQHLDLKPKEFGDKLGYDRPQAIYDVQKGKTKAISTSLANKIISVFPVFNKSWLLTGEGEMLKSNNTSFQEQIVDTREPIPAYVFDMLIEKDKQSSMLVESNKVLAESNKVMAEQQQILIKQYESIFDFLKNELQVIKKAIVQMEENTEWTATSGFNSEK